jgi:hypothetical protein
MSPSPSEPFPAGFSSDSLFAASGYLSAALPVNGDLVGGLPIVPTLPGLVARADVLQTGRLDWTGRLLNDYAIIALNNLQDNAGGDYRGDWSNPLDDAFLYAGEGLLYNQSPSLSSLAGSIVLGPDARLGNAPVGLEASDRLVRLAQPVTFELPIFGDLKAGALAGGLGPESVVDMSRTGLNSVADVGTVFPSGLGARRVFRVQNGGLNLPDGADLSNLVIIVERGDINFNGAGQSLRGVTLIAENGNVNLSGVVARDVSVLASGAIHMNRDARFSGENLLATEGGSVIFNGATTTSSDDWVRVFSAGDITFNAAAETLGEFWSGRTFTANSDSVLRGGIRAKQDVIFNAEMMVIYEHLTFAKDQPLIGIIDTGFAGDNPDIDYGRVQVGLDWIDDDADPMLAPGTGNEHGTHVLGTIGATRDNGIGIEGLNDKAPIWVSRAVGSGQWANALTDYVDAVKASGRGRGVLNLSFDLIQMNPDGIVSARYEFTPEERAALEYARQNNVLIIAAAGNDAGIMSVLGQASQEFENILTVGAADGNTRASYSNYGFGLDILAPGGTADSPIMSTVGNGIGTMVGTSVAAAQVTAAAAQVWAANPGLNRQQVIDILKITATDLEAAGWDEETGFGLLNVERAVEFAKRVDPATAAPLAAFSTPLTWGGEGEVIPLERAVNSATDFVGRIASATGAKVRSTPNIRPDNVIGVRAANESVRFTQWTYGDSVPALGLGTADERWYYDAVKGGWISSALVYGDAPGSTPLPPVAPGPVPSPTPTPGPVVPPGSPVQAPFYSVWQQYLSTLGNPTSGVLVSNGSRYQLFEGGSIVSSSFGTFPLYGGIRGQYSEQGGLAGWLGAPKSGEIGLGNGRIIQYFEGGHILWDGSNAVAHRPDGSQPIQNPVPGSVVPPSSPVQAPFYSVWQQYQSTLGNPTSGVQAYNGSRYQLFERGSIVSSSFGTFPIYGNIRQRYLTTGGLNGWLGVPRGEEMRLGNGTTIQYFGNGYIIWNGTETTAYNSGKTIQYPSITGNQPQLDLGDGNPGISGEKVSIEKTIHTFRLIPPPPRKIVIGGITTKLFFSEALLTDSITVSFAGNENKKAAQNKLLTIESKLKNDLSPNMNVALNVLSLSSDVNLDPTGVTWSTSYGVGITKLKFSYPSSTFELSFSPKISTFDKIFKVQTEAAYTLKGYFISDLPKVKPVNKPVTEDLPQWARDVGAIVVAAGLVVVAAGLVVVAAELVVPAVVAAAFVLVAELAELALLLGLVLRFG